MMLLMMRTPLPHLLLLLLLIVVIRRLIPLKTPPIQTNINSHNCTPRNIPNNPSVHHTSQRWSTFMSHVTKSPHSSPHWTQQLHNTIVVHKSTRCWWCLWCVMVISKHWSRFWFSSTSSSPTTPAPTWPWPPSSWSMQFSSLLLISQPHSIGPLLPPPCGNGITGSRVLWGGWISSILSQQCPASHL